jgi:hypothetical protein
MRGVEYVVLKEIYVKFFENTVVFLKLHILNYVSTTVHFLQRNTIKLNVQSNVLHPYF